MVWSFVTYTIDTPVRRVEHIKLGQVSAGETEENIDGGDTTRYKG